MNNRGIIELLKTLTSLPKPSRGFELPEDEIERHQQKKHRALRDLSLLQTDPTVRQMLSRVTREISPNGTIIVSELSGNLRDQVLQRVGEYSAILLREFLRSQARESRVTNQERFLHQAGAIDPFLEGANLTRDAFAGRAEVEPDTWANDVNLERRRS